ncbi:hypothetical protein EON65_50830 [archaeon]|nr:MAG: hypothetical protein EON65_50830 [archaeon]
MRSGSEFKKDVDFEGDIRQKSKGKFSARADKLFVRWHSLKDLLMFPCFYNDETIEQRLRVLTRAFAVTNEYIEACNEHHCEKRRNLGYSAHCRRELCYTLAESEVNSRFGTTAIAEKHFLGQLVPGDDTQKEKIARLGVWKYSGALLVWQNLIPLPRCTEA